MKTRKTPQRRCTGCLEMKDKTALIRVVRAGAESFVLDATGKQAGRGAYLCPARDCFQKARKQRGLERSFKQAIPPEIYRQLERELENAEIR